MISVLYRETWFRLTKVLDFFITPRNNQTKSKDAKLEEMPRRLELDYGIWVQNAYFIVPQKTNFNFAIYFLSNAL